MMRLVIVDDHPLILSGLEQVLRPDAGFEILAKVETADEGWAAIEKGRPDIVLLDLHLSGPNGFSLMRRLNPAEPPAVVILTAASEENLLLEAIELGARGIVLKATAPRILETCLRAVHRGDRWLVVNGVDLEARRAARHAIETSLRDVLTSREVEIVRLIDLGLNNDSIARRLAISVGTVKIHLHHIFDKLQLRGRQELQSDLQARGY